MFHNPAFLLWLLWHAGISISHLCFRWCLPCKFNHALLCNLYSLIMVCIGDHVQDNPRTALFAVIRGLESQDCTLAPDTPVRIPVLRQFYCSPDVNSSRQLLSCCRWWSLHFWNCSFDIQLRSIRALSVASWLQAPREALNTVEEQAISRIIPGNSANAPGENYFMWRTNLCCPLISKNAFMPLCLDVDLLLGLLQIEHLFRARCMLMWDS